MPGNSRVRTEVTTPPSERVPGGEIINQPGPFAPGRTQPAPPQPSPSNAGVASIMLRPNVGDELTAVSGTAATLEELHNLNAQFKGKAWSFPGGASDSNNVQWCSLACPIEWAPVPNLRVRVHLIVVS